MTEIPVDDIGGQPQSQVDSRADTLDSESILLTIRDVAALFRCSPRHVRRMTDDRLMPPPLALGALVRWPRSVIEKWVEEGCPPWK